MVPLRLALERFLAGWRLTRPPVTLMLCPRRRPLIEADRYGGLLSRSALFLFPDGLLRWFHAAAALIAVVAARTFWLWLSKPLIEGGMDAVLLLPVIVAAVVGLYVFYAVVLPVLLFGLGRIPVLDDVLPEWPESLYPWVVKSLASFRIPEDPPVAAGPGRPPLPSAGRHVLLPALLRQATMLWRQIGAAAAWRPGDSPQSAAIALALRDFLSASPTSSEHASRPYIRWAVYFCAPIWSSYLGLMAIASWLRLYGSFADGTKPVLALAGVVWCCGAIWMLCRQPVQLRHYIGDLSRDDAVLAALPFGCRRMNARTPSFLDRDENSSAIHLTYVSLSIVLTGALAIYLGFLQNL